MSIKHLPFPTMKINRMFDILEMSDTAKEIFHEVNSLDELMDEGNYIKRKKLLSENLSHPVELTLHTMHAPQQLFSVRVHWVEEEGIIQLFDIGHKLEKALNIVQEHERRLAFVDFELLAQKELAESRLDDLKRLSAPLIPISNEVALIPLFGSLDEQLIVSIQDRISVEIYEESYEKIIFDFSGVGSVSTFGMSRFEEFIEVVAIMGNRIFIVGIKPMHAMLLKQNKVDNVFFYPTLQEVLEMF